jgi:hypothetical protein
VKPRRAFEKGPNRLRGIESPAITEQLMEEVCGRENCKQALKRVKANKGSPGVDGMTVHDLPGYLKQYWPAIREQLLSGTYKPQPVKRVEIAKPDGGVRKLGIPTVLDRFVQQAVMQVLQSRWDRTFSNHSYGFDLGARRIRRWYRRSSISPKASLGGGLGPREIFRPSFARQTDGQNRNTG